MCRHVEKTCAAEQNLAAAKKNMPSFKPNKPKPKHFSRKCLIPISTSGSIRKQGVYILSKVSQHRQQYKWIPGKIPIYGLLFIYFLMMAQAHLMPIGGVSWWYLCGNHAADSWSILIDKCGGGDDIMSQSQHQ